jgi:hypothetical protein
MSAEPYLSKILLSWISLSSPVCPFFGLPSCCFVTVVEVVEIVVFPALTSKIKRFPPKRAYFFFVIALSMWGFVWTKGERKGKEGEANTKKRAVRKKSERNVN